MENKFKITYLIFLVFLLFGCSQSGSKKVENLSMALSGDTLNDRVGRIVIKDTNLIFEAPILYAEIMSKQGYYTIKNNVIQFIRLVTMESDTLYLKAKVDLPTFRMVGLSIEEKEKIRNPYYFSGRMNCYYIDKFNFYAYLDQAAPEFLLLGSSKDSELLGGNYIRLNGKIFSKGLPVVSVDIESFHTMEVLQDNNEWSRTIGLDKNNIYLDNKILNEEDFERLIAPNDSLKGIYFPN